MIPLPSASHLESVSHIVVALAAIFAAWQGVKGLRVWKNERLGGRKIELAEEALTQFFQVEHAFQAIRSPMGDAAESADREAEQHESPAQKMGRDLGYATWKRMDARSDLFQEFYVTGLKLRAYFGNEIYDQCDVMRQCFGRIRVSAQMLYSTPYEGYHDQELRRRWEYDVWDMGSDDPESIEVKVKNAVAAAERILGSELR